MLPSISGKALLRAGAAYAVLAAAALPAWSAGTVVSRSRQESDAAQSTASIESAEFFPEDAASSNPTNPPAATPATRKKAARRVDAAPDASLNAQGARSSVSTRGRVKHSGYQEGLNLEPIAERPTFVRPFRKIADILPYDSYEPDPEIAAKDKCFNLCPRPKGGECPDCAETDYEGRLKNGLPCPDCPAEQELRRIGRAAGESDTPFVPRNFAHIHYCWEPTNMYHHPIYFEDVALERYGHTRHYLLQPVCSNIKFAAQLLGLPYMMTIYPVCSRQYSLGYYRPGEEAPYLYYQVPLNAKAALVEAGVVAGGYFLFAPGVGP